MFFFAHVVEKIYSWTQRVKEVIVSTLIDWNNHAIWYVISCVYVIKFNLVFESGYVVKQVREKLSYPSLWSKSTRIMVKF